MVQFSPAYGRIYLNFSVATAGAYRIFFRLLNFFDKPINPLNFDYYSPESLKLSLLPVNKRKIINDPVHGFISLPYDIIFDLVEHPYFQRLRRIKQLGLTSFVYPGTNHTRFQHALGATYLMESAIRVIRSKGHEITDEEAEAVSCAILLHDIGHGPFSHALEKTIIEGISHEELSLLLMEKLNMETEGRLELAIKIFRDEYPKKFLHQLVASQLDMDRLDYLKRDSFFSGVTEGVIGSDRIIKMLNVKEDQLVIDIKGIYSIEKFLIARRLMYWQVYFHKTSIAAENLLLMVLKRAKELALQGKKLFASPALSYFLEKKINAADFKTSKSNEILDLFSKLDDNDILSAIKVWSENDDPVLARLCFMLNNRKLFGTILRNEKFNDEKLDEIHKTIMKEYSLNEKEANYFMNNGEISNFTYNYLDDRIKILLKNDQILDITEASDLLDFSALSKTVTKYFLCYPKELRRYFE